ncbi:MAG: hypothetical protein IMZ53_13080 [Thermoplasmata archaeon]|nr:hypothetical protein [Thermoplasmata archaeon]
MKLENLIVFSSIALAVVLSWLVFRKPKKKKYPIESYEHHFIANTYLGSTMPIKKPDLKRKLKAQKKLNRKLKKEEKQKENGSTTN